MTIFFNILGIAVFLILVIGIQKRPDFFFWLFLNLFFDPGGYISGFLGGNIFGRFNISDVFIFFIVVCLLSTKVNRRVIYKDKFLLKFLRFFFIYALYYFVVYGGIIPYLNNDFDYSTFLLKNRLFIYGFIILISVYVFSLRGLNYFYSITLFFGVICLSLYWISLLTGIQLSPVYKIERYIGSGMMRIGMAGYGYFYLMFPTALITYLISRKVKFTLKYKKWLYYGGIMMVLTLVITLTRRTIPQIIGIVIITVFILSYLFRTAKISTLSKLILPAMLALLILHFTFPKYIGYYSRIGKDTFMLLTTGKDTRGVGEYRVSGSGNLLLTKKYIKNNLWFGTGYSYLQYGIEYEPSPRGEEFDSALYAAAEVHIYYLFFGLGIVGAILIFPLYIIMVKLFFRISRLLKQNLFTYLENPLDVLFSIYVLINIASKFTYNLFNLGFDFFTYGFSSTAVFLGIGFALFFKLKEKHKEINTDGAYGK